MTKSQIADSLVAYPTLVLKAKPRRIEGDLPILYDDGQVLDTYQVRIKLHRGSFITRFPSVYETGGRIKPIADRHVYQDGQLCLGTPFAEERRLHDGPMDIDSFFQEILYPYFASQTLIEAGEITAFPQGERSHGTLGIAEEYMDFWQLPTIESVVDRLTAYLNRLGRNAPCFCHSGKKFKVCHQREVNRISFVERDLLKQDLNEMRDWLAKGQPEPKGLGRRFRRMG